MTIRESGTKYWRSVTSVMLGMAIAQAIPVIGSLALARLYAPADFGVFSAWLGAVLMASVVVTGRLEIALPMQEDGEPRAFATLATLVTIVGSCVVLAMAALVAFSLFPTLRAMDPVLVAAFPLATMLTAAVQTWQSWAAAEGQYRYLSGMRIAQSAGVVCTQILVGWMSPSAVALTLGHAFGLLLGVSVAACVMPLSLAPLRDPAQFVREIREFWSSNRRFPLLSLPADSVNKASTQLPLLLVTGKYGAEAGGLFALTMKALGAPIQLLGVAVLDVFKRNSAESFRAHGNCRDDFRRTFRPLAVGSLVMVVGVLVFSERIFVLAFGEPWRRAGLIAIWLMPLFAMRFVASPLSYVFYVASKQQMDLFWQCALLIVTVTAFALPSGFEGSVKVYSGGYSFLYAVYLCLSYRYSKGVTG